MASPPDSSFPIAAAFSFGDVLVAVLSIFVVCNIGALD
jgi:hypothetical protein